MPILPPKCSVAPQFRPPPGMTEPRNIDIILQRRARQDITGGICPPGRRLSDRWTTFIFIPSWIKPSCWESRHKTSVDCSEASRRCRIPRSIITPIDSCTSIITFRRSRRMISMLVQESMGEPGFGRRRVRGAAMERRYCGVPEHCWTEGEIYGDSQEAPGIHETAHRLPRRRGILFYGLENFRVSDNLRGPKPR